MPKPPVDPNNALAAALKQMVAGMGMKQGFDLGGQEPLGMELGTELGEGEMAPFLGGLDLGEKPPGPAMGAMQTSPPARTGPPIPTMPPPQGPPRAGPAMGEIDISPAKPKPRMGPSLDELDIGTEENDEEFEHLAIEGPQELMETPEEQDDAPLQEMERIEPAGDPMAPEAEGLPEILQGGAMWKGQDLFEVLTTNPQEINREDPDTFLKYMKILKQKGFDDLIEKIKLKLQEERPTPKTIEFKGPKSRAGEPPNEFME